MSLPGSASILHSFTRDKFKPTFHADKSRDCRWRCFTYDELEKCDKLNLAIFWLRDKSLEESDDLPEPDLLAQEIADDLQTGLDQFAAIALRNPPHLPRDGSSPAALVATSPPLSPTSVALVQTFASVAEDSKEEVEARIAKFLDRAE